MKKTAVKTNPRNCRTCLRLEWSICQSAFSQYLGGNVPLNIEAVLRLSKVLQIHPAEIMPDITELLPDGYGDATAATEQERDALALARLILELPNEQRVALQNVAKERA
ncbi:MAG: hypothetical protein PHO08_19905 [Methylococcales bacterium]|nr:hypothetical protein [Methylococcales bacterium]MDD5633575.1 hypothetical protein [Methylococcales bacterium]